MGQAAQGDHVWCVSLELQMLFNKELSAYAGAKGTVRFPLDKPIPMGLITKIVEHKIKENLAKEKLKAAAKAKSIK